VLDKYPNISLYKVREMFLGDNLRLGVIAGVFERHKLLVTENSVQLDYNELESVISDIYFVLQKEVLYDLDTSLATELMLNFLFLVFDR
jgi:hypothetical protein